MINEEEETKICSNCQDSHEISYFRNRKGEIRKWCQWCCDQASKWEQDHRSPRGQGNRATIKKKKTQKTKAQKKKEQQKRDWDRKQSEICKSIHRKHFGE